MMLARNIPGPVDIVCLCTTRVTGGAQNVAYQLTKSFQQRGYTASLGFLFEEEPGAYADVDSFVLAETAPASPAGWFGFLRSCHQTIGAMRPRAGFGFHPLANIVGSLFFGTGGRAISTQAWPSDQQGRGTALAESLLIRTPLSAGNIAVSQSVASTFSHWGAAYRRKTSVVYNNPSPLPAITDSVAECRARLNIGAGKPILGCIGRLHEQKNFRLAIQALPGAPDAHLYVAGAGPEDADLKALAARLGVADRTHFIGALHGADVTRFYRSIDVLLMPSLYEGHPLVMLEAMTQGVPIIANDIPVLREAGGDAAMYCPADPTAWSMAVAGLTDADFRRLSELGKVRAETFAAVSMVDRYLAVAGLPAFKESV